MRRYLVVVVAVALPLLAVALVLLVPAAAVGQGEYDFYLQPADIYGIEDFSVSPSTINCDYGIGGGVISCTADVESYSSSVAGVYILLEQAPAQAVALLVHSSGNTGYWQIGYGADGRPVWYRNAGPTGLPMGDSTLLDYGPAGNSLGLPGTANFPFDATAYALGSNYTPGRPAGFLLYQRYTTVDVHTTMSLRFEWVLWDVATPTPEPTPTNEPPPPGGRFGETCVYTPTFGGPPAIGQASVLQNGGFETWQNNTPPPWVAMYPGGFLPLLGFPWEGQRALSVRGVNFPGNLWYYFQTYEYVNIPLATEYRASVGFAGQCYHLSGPPTDCEVYFGGAGFDIPPGGGWRVYSATVPGVYPEYGGVVGFGDMVDDTKDTWFDGMWYILEALGPDGQWDVWCPEPVPDDPNATATATSTPWALPTIPLPTLAATPTFGPQPTIPPPVAITPQPTSCFEIGPDASEYGLDIPSVGVCLEPAELVITSPMLAPILAVVVGLIGAILGAVIVATILQLFRIGQ